jgi:iron complex transport system substrate-binding protein
LEPDILKKSFMSFGELVSPASKFLLFVIFYIGSLSSSLSLSPRIISLAPNLTEMLYAVGAGDELVGVSEGSNYPKSAQKLPVIADFEHIDLEKVLSLKPTLILAWAGGNSEVQLDQLRGFGISVKEISITDLLSVGVAIKKIGKLTGHESQGDEVSESFNQHYLALKKEGTSQKFKPRVFIEISEAPFYTPGKKSFLTNILSLCGAENAFPTLTLEASPVSIESIIAENPDVIIALKPADTDFWKNWPMINAVKNHRLYEVNPDLLARPGPRILDGAEKVCGWV